MNIHGQDLVAIEVLYHRSCYKDYPGFLVHQKGNKASGNQSYTSYKKAFVVFCCTDVDTCIIEKLQIMRMVSLQELLIVFCKEGSSLLADRWTSQSDLEKLESTDCEYDSEGEGPQLGSDYNCQECRRFM